jgi:hypothetical protein
MVTNRTPISRNRKVAITPPTIAAFRRVAEMRNDPKIEEYEEDGNGGRRDEYGEANIELDLLLGRKVWQATISDTFDCDEPPDWLHRQGADKVQDWINARDIRVGLNKAIGA